MTGTYGDITNKLDDSYFENNKEYSDSIYQPDKGTTVNYLGAINAAEAYKHFMELTATEILRPNLKM